MVNPVQVSDLESRWRPLSTQETVNAQAYLDDAWSLLTTRRPTLEADITATTVSQGSVERVVCAMVLRVLRNPDGYITEAVDDWSGTRSPARASGELFVTPEELADVTPAAIRTNRRSVRLVAYGDV